MLKTTMKVARLLKIRERPKGWSLSSYYRLRSVCRRLQIGNTTPSEVTHENLERFLKSVTVKITHKVDSKFNRTHKTYFTELKRYFNYLTLMK